MLFADDWSLPERDTLREEKDFWLSWGDGVPGREVDGGVMLRGESLWSSVPPLIDLRCFSFLLIPSDHASHVRPR